MKRSNYDERALSECAACHEEVRQGLSYYPAGVENVCPEDGIYLCQECADTFERELEYQLDSDVLAAEQWAALRLWVEEQQEQREQAQDEGEPLLKISEVEHEGAKLFHWEGWEAGKHKEGFCITFDSALGDALCTIGRGAL